MSGHSNDSTTRAAGHEPPGGRPGLPLWVKVSGIIVVLLALAIVAITMFTDGEHGPDRHASGQPAAGMSLQGTATSAVVHNSSQTVAAAP